MIEPVYMNKDERYGDSYVVTMEDYRELNPEGSFSKDKRAIYEKGNKIAINVVAEIEECIGIVVEDSIQKNECITLDALERMSMAIMECDTQPEFVRDLFRVAYDEYCKNHADLIDIILEQ